METIGVRELQQHASAALRRVERGETIGVTERARLVAVLIAPSATTRTIGDLGNWNYIACRGVLA